MHLRILSIKEFNDYQANHPLSNYYQTVNYAMLKAENNFEYDLVGLVDESDNILAASLILIKPIGQGCVYGYAPRGFLIDYSDELLVNTFTKLLKEFYYEKSCIFIKINPNLKIGKVDLKTFDVEYNNNLKVKNTLINNGYSKLRDNLYFESQLPRFNAIYNLKEYNPKLFSKNTRNKIKKSIRKGLVFKKYDKIYIKEFYKLVKNKKDSDEFYYQDYYTVFDKDNSIDLFLVTVDYDSFLQNSQFIYDEEAEKNNRLNEKIAFNGTDRVINAKMNSDRNLLSYKNDIMEATKGLSSNSELILAGALVIKHNNTASIMFSGFNPNYKRFAANYFLHYSLIKHYMDDYDYLDLNGVVGDFLNDNPYTGLNNFKLGFNPNVYEYIGEYDLVIEPRNYEILKKNGVLAKEFNKHIKK